MVMDTVLSGYHHKHQLGIPMTRMKYVLNADRTLQNIDGMELGLLRMGMTPERSEYAKNNPCIFRLCENTPKRRSVVNENGVRV